MTGERLCATCPVLYPAREKPRHYERAQCCESCRRRLAKLLADLPGLHALLPAAFGKGSRPQLNGSRIRSTPQASEPVNWRPWDLYLPADERKVGLRARAALGANDMEEIEDLKCQDGELSVATELGAMVADWLSYRPGEHLPDDLSVAGLCMWLGNRLEWACDLHPAIDEIAAITLELTRSVRSAGRVESAGGEYVGQCPMLLRDDTRCATGLRVDPYASRVQCWRCGTTWVKDRFEWQTLADEQVRAGLARWQRGKASA